MLLKRLACRIPQQDNEDHPDASLANSEKWAARIPEPTYAIDDQTAIKVVAGTVEVVSEGHWKLFTPDIDMITEFAVPEKWTAD